MNAPATLAQLRPQLSPVALDNLARLRQLRDEYAEITRVGRFTDSAAREWMNMELKWRMALLLIAGVSDGMEDLDALCERPFTRFLPEERARIKREVRLAKAMFGRLAALATRD